MDIDEIKQKGRLVRAFRPNGLKVYEIDDLVAAARNTPEGILYVDGQLERSPSKHTIGKALSIDRDASPVLAHLFLPLSGDIPEGVYHASNFRDKNLFREFRNQQSLFQKGMKFVRNRQGRIASIAPTWPEDKDLWLVTEEGNLKREQLTYYFTPKSEM